MEFNLTAKDKHALKMLTVDLRDSLKTKKGEGPQFTYFKDISFFKTAEGKQLDDLIEWVQDFIKRLNDADKNQIEKEKNSEIEELTNAGWLGKINPE